MAGQAKYKLNPIGYLPASQKLVYSTNPASMEFTVEHLYITQEYKPVFTGVFQKVTGDDGTIFVGDFSEVTAEGDYRIVCGGEQSRFFRIQKNVYEYVLRILLLYFKWQRCGSPLGWAGECHMDDGYIAETGEHIDLSGGYHQSCDLRKSPCGVAFGVLNMIRAYTLSKNYSWAEMEWKDEIRWAADYYVKTVQECGRIYNTLNAPFGYDGHGWEGKVFYLSEPPASASWTAIRILAEASCVIEDRKEVYLQAASRAFNYMTSEERHRGKYTHPGPTPRGMDQEYFFNDIYMNSTADLSYAVCAAVSLYKATGEEKYYAVALEKCTVLMDRFVESDSPVAAAMLKVDEDNNDIISSSSYVKISSGYEAFFDMLSCIRDETTREKLLSITERVAEHYRELCQKSIWCLYPKVMSEKYLDTFTGFAGADGKLKIRNRDIIHTTLYPLDKQFVYTFNGIKVNSHLQCAVDNLRLSETTRYPYNMDIAQHIIDGIMGCNMQDISFITGVGQCQVQPMVYGQFFPSTPQIPGGITIGGMEGTIDCASYSEYDMPAVGLAMYVLSLLTQFNN